MEAPVLRGPTSQNLAAAHDYGRNNLPVVDEHAGSSAGVSSVVWLPCS
jgi:hypothetical protein